MASLAQSGFADFSLSHLATQTAKRTTGAVLLALGLATGLALLGFSSEDPSFTNETSLLVNNPLGKSGAIVADLLLQLFGLGAHLLWVVWSVWGFRLLVNRPLPWPWLPVTALPLAMLALCACLAVLTVPDGNSWPYDAGLGGVLGDYLLFHLQPKLGPDSYLWSSLTFAVAGSLVAIGVSWIETVWLIRNILKGLRWSFMRGSGLVKSGFTFLFKSPSDGSAATASSNIRKPGRTADAESSKPGFFARVGAYVHSKRRTSPVRVPADDDDTDLAPTISTRLRRPVGQDIVADDDPVMQEPDVSRPRRRKSALKLPKTDNAHQESLDLDHFILPDLNLLAPTKGRPNTAPSAAHIKNMSAELETVLDDYGVRGQILDAKPGPVVTMFELEPAPGTRAARVVNLAEDMGRSLCAISVRVATVPGRNILGIELPNEKRETVMLRALFESEAFADSQARLALALGKDIAGHPIIVDLARMPHLLIAGTTGSGKSVAINAMILSLLYRLTPEECRIIMIDPKVIELSVYEDIPHLLAPVVTEPHKAIVALKWVVRQMDERYRLMSHLGVRDIIAYNRRLEQARARGEALNRRVRTGFEPGTGAPIYEEIPIDMNRLPLIVVIVDEVADLMLTAGKEIEGAIQRLSQKARAAGIHLIVATQRPSVDVLTGVIKANLPSRISFRVSSKIDSRTILGEPGAEQLLGQGDMLYLMPGDRISRIHGPLVTDDEVERVVSHLKAQGFPDYHDEITSDQQDSGSSPELPGFESDSKDDLYNNAVQIVARDGKASTSYLQRQLSIGYNSAAKLIERMESEGLISSADHVGRRQVLMGRGGVNGDEPTDL